MVHLELPWQPSTQRLKDEECVLLSLHVTVQLAPSVQLVTPQSANAALVLPGVLPQLTSHLVPAPVHVFTPHAPAQTPPATARPLVPVHDTSQSAPSLQRVTWQFESLLVHVRLQLAPSLHVWAQSLAKASLPLRLWFLQVRLHSVSLPLQGELQAVVPEVSGS